jgi:uncharacterized protein (DUF2336 family)
MSDQRLTKPQGKEDEARLLHAAARERLAVAAADLALPERLRLSDWQRTTVSALYSKLVRTVEDELRSNLVQSGAVQFHEGLAAAFTSAQVSIAGPVLERSTAQPDRGLVAALVRRTEEHRRARGHGAGEMPILIEFIKDRDPHIAEHAMAILIAQSRRFDSFSEPAAARTELSAELEHRLVWRVAAALRHYMIAAQGFDPVAADWAIVAAAERLLAAYDEGDALDARAMRLAKRLQETERLTDAFVERALSEGSLPLFLAGLGVRASLSHIATWEILSDPRARGPVFLLKVAGVERAPAVSILLALAASEEEVSSQVDLFDVTDAAAASDAIRLWQVNPGYREAIAELSA